LQLFAANDRLAGMAGHAGEKNDSRKKVTHSLADAYTLPGGLTEGTAAQHAFSYSGQASMGAGPKLGLMTASQKQGKRQCAILADLPPGWHACLPGSERPNTLEEDDDA